METSALGTAGADLDALVASFNSRINVLRNVTLVRDGLFAGDGAGLQNVMLRWRDVLAGPQL